MTFLIVSALAPAARRKRLGYYRPGGALTVLRGEQLREHDASLRQAGLGRHAVERRRQACAFSRRARAA